MGMNPAKGLLEAANGVQQRHKVTAFVVAVNKKYGDDRGGYLAALITYYGFLSIFPLLLASFTIAAYVLAGDTGTLHHLQRSVGAYPIIGSSVSSLTSGKLGGSALALIVSLLGMIWGGQGLAQTLQFAMNEIWNVPNKARPGFAPRLAKGLTWYATFGLGFVVGTYVNSLGSAYSWVAGPVLSGLLALVINIALFVVSFRVLSPKDITLRQLGPGGAFAGVVWTILTTVGIGLLKQLSGAKPGYGEFGATLGLLAFLYLAARISLYAAEANVVAARGLWPRSLLNDDPVEADRRQLRDIARREERVDDQTVTVQF